MFPHLIDALIAPPRQDWTHISVPLPVLDGDAARGGLILVALVAVPLLMNAIYGRRTCPICHGDKKQFDPRGTGQWHECRRCNGDGWVMTRSRHVWEMLGIHLFRR